MESVRVHQSLPWWFRTIQERIAHNKRGPWLMLSLAERLGMMKGAAWFPLRDKSRALIPLNWPEIYVPDRVNIYEAEAIEIFVREIDTFAAPALLVDCGSDIGLFSRLVLSFTSNVREVVLMEPNPRSFAILKQNFEGLSVPARMLNSAVSDFEGFAELVASETDPHDHARYIKRAASGIPVTTIDAQRIPDGHPLALKIDVEGAELQTLGGGKRTIAEASEFVIQIEAAKDVFQRTGQDPIEFLRFVSAIRPCSFRMCCENTRVIYDTVDLNKPFFPQFAERHRALDVVMRSQPG